MTCHPKQSNFLIAKKLGVVNGSEAVVEAGYFIDESFVDAFYKSCRGVQMPALGYVMVLLCGAPPGTNCLLSTMVCA